MNNIKVRAISVDHKHFRNYLELKYIIFVNELGWQLQLSQSPGLVETDTYDHFSNHFIAYSARGNPVGIIRATPIETAFPYRELLEKYISPELISVGVDKLCVITSLAVLPEFRGKSVTYRGQHITTAKSLLWTAIDDLRDTGFEVCLLTAVEGASDAFFERSGAYPMSEKYYLDRFTNHVRDFAILINDSERFKETNSYLGVTCNPRELSSNERSTRQFLRSVEYSKLTC